MSYQISNFDFSTKQPLQLISCLSPSWGGLEMVADEMVGLFLRNQQKFMFICLAGSPLHQRLQQYQVPCLAISQLSLWSMYQVNQFLSSLNLAALSVHKLADLRFFMPLMIKNKKIKIVGYSHSFIAVNKNDFLHRWLYRRLDVLVALTNLHMQNLLQHLPIAPEKMCIIPNSVDRFLFSKKNKIPQFKKSLGFLESDILVGLVSRLDPGKGQLMALKALAHIKQKGSHSVKLVFVGQNTLHETDFESELKSFIEKNNLKQDVYFLGHRNDIAPVVASFDILIQPSKAETFGRSIIEGMSAAVPVISTQAGGVPDILQNEWNGLLVSPENDEELAQAIEKLIVNTALRVRLVQQAELDVAQKYDKTQVHQLVMDLYRSADRSELHASVG